MIQAPGAMLGLPITSLKNAPMVSPGDVTALLGDWSRGNRTALDQLLPLVYEEAAHVLSVSPSTVKRDWRTAKAWLNRELGSEA